MPSESSEFYHKTMATPKTTDPNLLVLFNPQTGQEQSFGLSNVGLNEPAIRALQSQGYESYIQGLKQQFTPTTAPTSITGDLLTPATGLPYTTPTPTPALPVTIPAAPVPLGTEQQKESDVNKQIQELQDIISGKPAYEIEQRQKFGVEEKIATQQSIFKQLQNLKAFTENIPAQLQAESEGRGRTAGGIEPIQAGRLRNAGIQATILNAQYSAATGDLATAERQVRQAVFDKFAPFESERDAKLANLKLIQDSPEYTNEQKARAMTQAAKIKADQDKAEAAKSIYEDIIKLSTAVTGSDIQDGQNSLIANAVTDLVNTDEEALGANVDLLAKAQALAAKYLVKKEKEVSLGTDFERYKFFAQQRGEAVTQEGFLKFQASEAAAGRAGEKAPKASAGKIGGIDVSQTTLNAFEGFEPQTPTERSELQANIVALGLHLEEPQEWFKKEAEKQLQMSITPERLKELWDEERQPVLDLLEKSELGRTP